MQSRFNLSRCNLDAFYMLEVRAYMSIRSIGTSGQLSSRFLFRQLTGMTIVDCYFHYSFHLAHAPIIVNLYTLFRGYSLSGVSHIFGFSDHYYPIFFFSILDITGIYQVYLRFIPDISQAYIKYISSMS